MPFFAKMLRKPLHQGYVSKRGQSELELQTELGVPIWEAGSLPSRDLQHWAQLVLGAQPCLGLAGLPSSPVQKGRSAEGCSCLLGDSHRTSRGEFGMQTFSMEILLLP